MGTSITLKHYDKTHTIEFDTDDVDVVRLVYAFYKMLVASGWTRESAAKLFDGDPEDWDVT